jgi:hypothetical protein
MAGEVVFVLHCERDSQQRALVTIVEPTLSLVSLFESVVRVDGDERVQEGIDPLDTSQIRRDKVANCDRTVCQPRALLHESSERQTLLVHDTTVSTDGGIHDGLPNHRSSALLRRKARALAVGRHSPSALVRSP